MDIPFILWIVTFAFFCVVIIQVFYLVYLSHIPAGRAESSHGEAINPAPKRQDSSTHAQNSDTWTDQSGQHPSNTTMPVPTGTPRVGSATQSNLSAVNAPASATIAPTTSAHGKAASPSSIISGIGKMVVLSGLPEPLEINLPALEFGIGRFANPDRKILVVLDEKSVSREHAFLQYNAQLEHYFLTDKSSSYGTYILLNDQFDALTPEQPQQIFNEDVVQFGNQVKVRFLLPGVTRASVTQL